MKRVFISALCLIITLNLFSCTQSQLTPVEDIIKNPNNYTVKIEDQGTRFPFENYEDLEKVYVERHVISEKNPNPSPAALLKFKVIGYGDTNVKIPNRRYTFTEYKVKAEKIIKNFSNLFPDVKGKELTFMRGFYIDDGSNDICFHIDESYPFIKDEEYYGIVFINEYEGGSSYMALYNTFMAKDYMEVKEFEPYRSLINEHFNYSLLRKGLLEKYEGMKFD